MTTQDNINYEEKVQQQLSEIIKEINNIINIMKGQQ